MLAFYEPPPLKHSAQNNNPPLRKQNKKSAPKTLDQKPNHNIRDMIRKINEKAAEETIQNNQPDQPPPKPTNQDQNSMNDNVVGEGNSANQTVPLCTFNKHGFCKAHRILGKQIEIPKSVWKDRSGGRGFGFVKTKVKKYICPLKNSALVAPNIYPSNIHSTSPSIGDIVEQREGLLHVSRNIPEHSSDNDGIRRLVDRNSLKVRVRN